LELVRAATTRARIVVRHDALVKHGDTNLFDARGARVGAFEGGGILETKFNASGGYTDNGSDRDGGGNPAAGLLRRDIAPTDRDRDVGTTGKATLPLWQGHALAVGRDAGRAHRADGAGFGSARSSMRGMNANGHRARGSR
jgi:hypothetical protein